MDRRRFLKVTAITGTSAALASCGSPENQVIRFVPDDEITPGIAVWKPSVCPLCAAGCGVTARVMDGDAEVIRNGQPGVTRTGLVKKLEGDPEHPLSQGKLCVRGQAAVQVTYHPDRIVAPMRRKGDRGSGEFAEISWDEALNELVDRLDAVVSGAGASQVAFISRPRRGKRQQLVAEFLRRMGAPAPVSFEVFDDAVLRRANEMSFGRHQLPTFDLARTRYLIGFGADFLGTWNSPLAHSVAYGRMRQAGGRPKFVQVEPRVSQTGASADEWVAIRPGTEGFLALGLAHVIIKSGARPASAGGRAGALVDGWSGGLEAFTPEAVERETGVQAARVERLAREFASHGPAVAVIGGAALAHTNGLVQALAVNALNALVGSVDAPGGVSFMPQAGAPATPARTLRDALGSAAPQVLLLDEADALFGSPSAWKAADWLRQVPFIASFGSFIDDTSAHADLILPDHSFLESWVESVPESGAASAVATVAGPAMKPLYDTRSTPDVLLEVGRRLMQPLNPPLPWQTFDEMAQAKPESGPAAAGAARSAPPAPARAAASAGTAWRAPEFDGDAQSYPFHFAPYPSQALLDGSLAHLPWLQELPDPLTTAMWCSWVEMNPEAARKLGIADGDIVEIASAHGSLRAPVVLSPGIGPAAVAMPVGQGHEHFTRYASGRGANPLTILAPVSEATTGQLAWSATRVKVTRVADADGTLILFAGATRERPDHARGRG
jgi:menaquinone reductase, molybdopterin-binding-like subunit